MLMISVILVLLVLVLAMTGYIELVGTSLGSTIDQTRVEVINWILT